MSCRTVSAGGVVEFVGIGLAVGNQIFDGFDAGTLLKFRRDDKHIGNVRDERDRFKIFDRIVGKLLEQVRVDGVCGNGSDAQSHTVGLLLREISHTAVTAGARTVVNNNVAKLVVNGFGNGACRDIQRASRRIGNNDFDGIGTGAGLSRGSQRNTENRDGTHGTDQITTTDSHFIFLSS